MLGAAGPAEGWAGVVSRSPPVSCPFLLACFLLLSYLFCPLFFHFLSFNCSFTFFPVTFIHFLSLSLSFPFIPSFSSFFYFLSLVLLFFSRHLFSLLFFFLLFSPLYSCLALRPGVPPPPNNSIILCDLAWPCKKPVVSPPWWPTNHSVSFIQQVAWPMKNQWPD